MEITNEMNEEVLSSPKHTREKRNSTATIMQSVGRYVIDQHYSSPTLFARTDQY